MSDLIYYCLVCGIEHDLYEAYSDWCSNCSKLGISQYLSCCDKGKEFIHIEYRGIEDKFTPKTIERGYYIIDDERDYCMIKIDYCPFCGTKV